MFVLWSRRRCPVDLQVFILSCYWKAKNLRIFRVFILAQSYSDRDTGHIHSSGPGRALHGPWSCQDWVSRAALLRSMNGSRCMSRSTPSVACAEAGLPPHSALGSEMHGIRSALPVPLPSCFTGPPSRPAAAWLPSSCHPGAWPPRMPLASLEFPSCSHLVRRHCAHLGLHKSLV